MKMPLSDRSPALPAGLLIGAGAAVAQGSAKPIKLRVPYPAWGRSDAIARIFNAPLGRGLGQPVLVENLGGQVDVALLVDSAAMGALAVAPMTLAGSARFFEPETARCRAIARPVNLQPQ